MVKSIMDNGLKTTWKVMAITSTLIKCDMMDSLFQTKSKATVSIPGQTAGGMKDGGTKVSNTGWGHIRAKIRQ